MLTGYWLPILMLSLTLTGLIIGVRLWCWIADARNCTKVSKIEGIQQVMAFTLPRYRFLVV